MSKSKMYEIVECRFQVLEMLSNASMREMCNLRTELFMVAAASSNAENCLMPFPACFFDRVKKRKRIKDLQEKIQQIPKLSNLTEYTPMDDEVWELLYWVFTNPLTIQPVPPTQETFNAWTAQTGLSFDNFRPGRHLLYTVVNPTPNQGFLEGKAKYGTKFAFHGSLLENFHSVIHRGLMAALNKRSAYGYGTYLSTSLQVSLRYAEPRRGWKNSEIGSIVRCVAICEVVDDPSISKYHFDSSSDSPIPNPPATGGWSYFVVAKDDLIQLSHLIVIALI